MRTVWKNQNPFEYAMRINKLKSGMTKPKWLVELLQTAPDAGEFHDFETTVPDLLSEEAN
jgi:hypothetical protein